ncbi:non-ribosomal peptide synthetase [Gordonia hankookensis]|uniref:Amino acid adenylation domain-containing protein n=1 Tax=Gordonia hankookensis TaxID=589403 RepID=A0ABR7WAP6_9ACTN|nr:non-ribosomal peptide synthetase [Gordonia hankookensis]MBD1319867.1 amino acid adenylation domain-containing protein [Gordonia hankookensis]
MEVPEVSAAPEIEDVLALSPLQEGLFALSEMSGDGIDLYSMQFVVEITGPLDRQILRRSVDVIMERHPNLRVSLWDKDLPKPVQIVPSHVDVPWEELSATATDFDDIAAAERADRFDLRRGPSLRVKLIDLPGERSRLLVTAHHILMDGWAIALFFGEILAIYSADGSAASLPPVRPYRNYIAWLAAQDVEAARASWREHLDGVEPLMIAAPTVPVTEPVRTRHRLSVADTERLVSWARSSGLTANTVTQFAWAVVLSRLTDRTDVVFGTTISGRPQGLAGADEMIGLFINTVPSRVRLSGTDDGRPTTVAAVCAALQRDSASMRDQGHLGLSEIQRSAGHATLFDTLFIFENAPIGAATEPVTAADGTRFLPLAMESLAHYPLTVVAYLLDGELIVITESIDDALGEIDAADVAERILAVLRALPDAADTDVDHLDVLLPAERAALEQTDHDAPADLPATVVEAFVRQCERTPTAPALVTDDESITYGELFSHASQLAAELRDHGIEPETVVAVALPRSTGSVVAILATMLAGGAYVPIDLAFPDTRIANLLDQSGAAVVVTDRAHAGRFADSVLVVPDDPETANRIAARAASPALTAEPAISPASAAYLIFTSGSTGEPKGVIGTHAALMSYCRDHRDHMLAPARARLGRPLRIAHAWTFSFDASWQPLAGLLDGHAIHLFGEDEMRDAGRLVADLARHAIDMIDTTPSMFGQLAAAGLVGGYAADGAAPAGGHLSVLALGGEAIGPALWGRLSALPDTVVHNCYGPTETTVEAVVARVADSAVPTIGTPTDRMSAYVLDSRLRPTPTGVAGELYLSGAQVTRGYQRKPAMTSTRFVADPFRPHERMYRTGDLVRRNAAGNILFVGRSDDQVKIRGYRIETGEVEAAIRRADGVAAAAVVVVDRAAGPALVGFAAGDDVDARAVRAHVAKALPAHMVPSRVVGVPVLPMNSNGKVDAIVLAESAAAALQARATADDVDLTPTATIVAGVIADVLGTAPGPDEDFFDLGLDSIVAMAAVNALRGHDLTVTPRMVLSCPTVLDLADAIDNAEEDESFSAGPGLVPALPVVEWMYEYGNHRRFTQTVLFALPAEVSDDGLIAVLQATIDAHDMLRSIVTEDGLITRDRGTVDAASVLFVRDAEDLAGSITAAARAANDRIDPDSGRMVSAVRMRRNDSEGSSADILLLAIHHLAVDAVSWQVLFADLARAGSTLDGADDSSTIPALPEEHTDYRAWCRFVEGRADNPDVLAQQDYWTTQVAGPDPAVGARQVDPTADTWASLRSAVTTTDIDVTATILKAADRTVGVREFLLAALTLTVAGWRVQRGQDATGGAYIALEGHGREDHLGGAGVDTSRTLGWFTSVFPVRLGVGRSVGADDVLAEPDVGRKLLDEVARQVAEIPSGGVDFGVLKYLSRIPGLQAPMPQIEFNYLGRFDLHTPDTQWQPWSPITDLDVNEHLPTDPEPDLPLRYALDVVAVIRATDHGPQLVTNWRYGDTVLTAGEVGELTAMWERSVVALAGALEG